MAKKHLWLSTLNDGVLDQYHTELYIVFLKDGSISLHPSTWCVEYPRFWDKARRGIKTPRQLIDAYNDIDQIDMDSFIDFELPRELFKLNPCFAVVTDWYLEHDYDDEREELLVFSLKYLSKNKIVLPDNFDDALKSFSLIFNSIKKYYDKNGKLPIRKLEH